MSELFPGNTFVAPKMPRNGKDLVRLVVAEAPGELESQQGEPLIGGSGHVFDKLCRHAGIDRDGLTIINTLNCRPPSNLYPTDSTARSYISKADGEKAVKQCIRNHVLPVLKSRAWKRLDLLGEKAMYWLTGKSGIMKLRGSPVDIDTDEVEVRVKN
jgi:uracil-DNA glycosylase family 4